VCTQPAVPRAMAAEELAKAFGANGLKAVAQPDVDRALSQARAMAGNDGVVLVAGSLYLIGAVRTLLRQEKEFSDVI